MIYQVLLIVGLFLIYYGIKENRVQKEYNWPVTQGLIVESIIESRNQEKDIIIISKFQDKYFFQYEHPNLFKEYRLRLKYQYQVGNHIYNGSFIEEKQPHYWSLYDTHAKKNQLIYHVGKKLPVYYQPENPQNSFLDLTPRNFNYYYLVIGICFILPYFNNI